MNLLPVYSLSPVTIVRAQGSRVYDENGLAYLDFYGGHAVISIGHGHPHWIKRIEAQMQKISFYSNSLHLPIQEELAEKLGRVSGRPDYQLFLCNSGAEANENAFKLASFHTGRKKILSFTKAFHGRTSLAVSATDNPALIAPVNQTANVDFSPFNDVAALDDYFARNGSELAAVIFEGIQGVGGIRVASLAFLQSLRRHCDASGTVLIADSVQCGYGRSGKFFSSDHAGISADLYTCAKGMGNGFPVAAVLVSPQFTPKLGSLGTTFGGNPLACAASLAVLEVMEEENLIQVAAQNGQYLMDQLSKMPELENLRGRGLMIGFDVSPPHQNLRARLLKEFRIFTGEAKPNTIRLLPALNIQKAEIDELVSSISHLLQNPKP